MPMAYTLDNITLEEGYRVTLLDILQHCQLILDVSQLQQISSII